MKFTVERDALAEAVTWTARALPARPVVPVLSGLLISAGQEEGGGFLTLSCFDYEVSARVRVPAEVAEPGTVLVPGRLLVEIVRALPPHQVSVADDPDGVSVSCGDAAFMLTPLPLGEYPDLPELPQLAGTADGGTLATAIGQVTPAARRDDTLPMLTAVSIELDGPVMTLAATDRYRLAVRNLDWNPAPGAGQDGAGPAGAGPGRQALLVPARTLSDAARMMSPGTEARVMMSLSPSAEAMIGFETGERRLTTRLLAGEFIRYKSRFPAEFGCAADLPADAFAEAVRRVALVAERGTPVQLSFAPGRVTVGAATQGQARARETVAAGFTGDQPSIAFNPQYLLDGLAAIDSDTARLAFTEPGKPALLTGKPAENGQPDYRYLLMPIRLAG